MRRPTRCCLYLALSFILTLAPNAVFADHVDNFQSVGCCKFFSEPIDLPWMNESHCCPPLPGGNLELPGNPASLYPGTPSKLADANAITFVYQKRSSRTWNFDFHRQADNFSAARTIKRASIPTILIRNRSHVKFQLSAATMRVSSNHWGNLAAWQPPGIRWASELQFQLMLAQRWIEDQVQSLSDRIISSLGQVADEAARSLVGLDN